MEDSLGDVIYIDLFFGMYGHKVFNVPITLNCNIFLPNIVYDNISSYYSRTDNFLLNL